MATSFTEDSSLSAQENFNLFLEGQAEIDYTLGDYTSSADEDMKLYTELKIKAEQEKNKVTAFINARELAREEVVAQQTALMSEFNTLWQAKEDAGYDVDFVPQ